MLPAWAGLVYEMAKRSREGYFVDIIPEGVAIGTPADRYFLKKAEITGVRTSRFFPAIPTISIFSGRRRIIVRKLVRVGDLPEKKPLGPWLAAKVPSRTAIREGMNDLKRALEALVGGRQVD